MDTSPRTSPLMRAVAPRLDRTQQHDLPVQSRTSAGHGETGAVPTPKQSTASAPVIPLPSYLEPTEMVEVAPIIQQEATITNITSRYGHSDQEHELQDLDSLAVGSAYSTSDPEHGLAAPEQVQPIDLLHEISSTDDSAAAIEHDQPIRPPYTKFEAWTTPNGFVPLDYRPVMLKASVTISVAVFYMLVILCIELLVYCSDQKNTYTILDPNVYMAARFSPSIIGTITTTLVRSFLSELCRMLPYIRMADHRKGGRSWNNGVRASESIAALYFPTFGGNTNTAWAITMLQVITTPLIAAKLALLEVIATPDGWAIVVHRSVSHSLVAYYGVQVLVLGYVTWWLWKRQTGLRSDWDPTSIADIITLFQHFNVEPAAFIVPADRVSRLWPLREWRFRLGHWKVSYFRDPDCTILLGVRCAYGIRGIPVKSSWVMSKETQAKFTRACNSHRQASRFPYRFLTVLSNGRIIWMMKAALGLSLVLAIFAVIAAKMTSQMFTINLDNRFGRADISLVLANVSNPNVTAAGPFFFIHASSEEAERLSVWNFILRTIPVTIAGMTILIIEIFSRFHLYTQPLKEMYTGPKPASETILLDYITLSTPAVLVQSWEHSHWKVFYFVLLNMLGPIVQLVPTDMLTLASKDDIIYGSFSRGFVIATIALLVLYLSSYVYGYCSAKHLFPRWGTSLIDIWAMCFSSRLAGYPEFSECRPGWTKQDLVASLQIRSDQYSLGLVKGLDGCERIGFDVATFTRQQTPTGVVCYVPAKKPHKPTHCFACANDKEYHKKDEVQEKLRLLSNQYGVDLEPIEHARGFEESVQPVDLEASPTNTSGVAFFAGGTGGVGGTGNEGNDANAVGGAGMAVDEED